MTGVIKASEVIDKPEGEDCPSCDWFGLVREVVGGGHAWIGKCYRKNDQGDKLPKGHWCHQYEERT